MNVTLTQGEIEMSGTLQSKILRNSTLRAMNAVRGREAVSKSGRACDTPARVKCITRKDLALQAAKNGFKMPTK